MMVAVLGDPISFFEDRTLIFYLKDHPLNIQFRIFNGQLFANSYDYITSVGRGWGCC